MTTDREYRLVRKLIEAHVDDEVASIVLDAVDGWHGVVRDALEVRERALLADEDGYVTVRQIRERWGCGDETVRRLIAAGELPEFRANHGVRVPKDAVLEFEMRHTTLHAPDSAAPRPVRRHRPAEEVDTLQRYPWLED